MGDLIPLRSCLAPGTPLPGQGLDRRRARLWRLLWTLCPGVGWVRLEALAEAFPGLEGAWQAPFADLVRLPGWNASLERPVQRFRGRWGSDPLPRLIAALDGGRRVLLPGDGRWPAAMGQLSRPPQALHWRGRGSLLAPLARRRAVAVVGTRRPSLHGRTMARRIGEALAAAGWPVVSGLAEGIDAEAHAGCLAGGGAPVAVLGTPLARVYPGHHRALQAAVGRQGLLISEHPPGAPVQPGNFAERNRLLVALAAAVVVVECPKASGALHSAERAWEQELPLWVVPGDAARASAAGSNGLLARGATPLLGPDDLIHQLGSGPLAPPPALAMPTPEGRSNLLVAVGGGACLEEIALQLRRPSAEVAVELLDLELQGLLRAEPGLFWRPL